MWHEKQGNSQMMFICSSLQSSEALRHAYFSLITTVFKMTIILFFVNFHSKIKTFLYSVEYNLAGSWWCFYSPGGGGDGRTEGDVQEEARGRGGESYQVTTEEEAGWRLLAGNGAEVSHRSGTRKQLCPHCRHGNQTTTNHVRSDQTTWSHLNCSSLTWLDYCDIRHIMTLRRSTETRRH